MCFHESYFCEKLSMENLYHAGRFVLSVNALNCPTRLCCIMSCCMSCGFMTLFCMGLIAVFKLAISSRIFLMTFLSRRRCVVELEDELDDDLLLSFFFFFCLSFFLSLSFSFSLFLDLFDLRDLDLDLRLLDGDLLLSLSLSFSALSFSHCLMASNSSRSLSF